MKHRKTALLYSNRFNNFDYGKNHPFKLSRFELAYNSMRELGIVDSSLIHNFSEIEEDEIYSFHSREYIAKLKKLSATGEGADFAFGLGDADCPLFKSVYEYSLLGAGGTFKAAKMLIEEDYDAVLNLSGGWHHAHKSKAAGFSYINDAVLAINYLARNGNRVVYIDIDAHHGDGVQEAFYDRDDVLTISLHESGIYFFPGSGFENETGSGKGRGYSVNIPLLAHTDDALYMKAFDEIAYPLIAAFNPDIIVAQIGVDSFLSDPLTNLEITTNAYSYIIRKISRLKIKWMALGGGGYDLFNTTRGWSIAWCIMNDIDIPEKLPQSFMQRFPEHLGGYIVDKMHWSIDDERDVALYSLQKSIQRLKKSIFPVIIGNYKIDAGI